MFKWFKKYYGKDPAAKAMLWIALPIFCFLLWLAGASWWFALLVQAAAVGLFYIKRKTL